MDDQNQNLDSKEENSTQPEELSFTDKVTGIFTEPSKVFEYIKISSPKTTDWFIPVLLLALITIFSNYIITSIPDIRAELDAFQRKATEEAFDKAVKEGRMTEEEKEERMEQIEKMKASPAAKIFQYASIAVMMFVILFLLSAIYYAVWVFLLKGQGSYQHALSVYGLASFISILEVIIMTILSIVMVKFVTGIHPAAFLDIERGTTLSYVLSKINPFTFWWLYVIGSGLGKIFSVSKNKSLIAIFILWLIYAIAGRFIPFLSFGF